MKHYSLLHHCVVMGLLALLAACGEPPTIQQASAPNNPGGATTSTTSAAPQKQAASQPESSSAALPPGVPKDADIATIIKTPGVRGGQVVIAVAQAPKYFNPVLGDSIGDQFVASQLNAGLYGFDWQLQKEIPGLAKSWEYNEKTHEWTFHLREGLKWSDGQPLTADDFIFFTEVVFDPAVSNDFNFSFRLEAKADSPKYEFRAPNPTTLIVKIPGVDSFAFVNLGQMMPLPRHTLEKAWKAGRFNDAWGQTVNPAEVVASGPFVLKENHPGEAARFARNPFYFRYDPTGQQLPYLDQLTLLIVPDMEAEAIRFLAGDTDIFDGAYGGGIRPSDLATFQDKAKAGNFTIFPLGPGFDVAYYAFNTNLGGSYTDEKGLRQEWQPGKRGERPPVNLKEFRPFVDPVKLAWFNNREFRIACSELTNRKRIIDNILFGQGSPLYGFIPPANKEWFDTRISQYPYNPQDAKARLEKIGFIDRNGDGLREDPQGHTIRFSLLTNRENDIREKIGQILKEDFRAAGIELQPDVQDFNTLTTKINRTMDYDAYLMGFGSGVPPHPAMESNIWPSGSRLHWGYPRQKVPATDWEAELDTLYTKMKLTFDAGEQRKIYDRMQEIFAAEVPAIQLYSMNINVAARNTVQGLRPAILRGSLTHNIDELWIKKK